MKRPTDDEIKSIGYRHIVRDEFNEFATFDFKKFAYAVMDAVEAKNKAEIEDQAVAWMHEDELPESYPYEVMFPYSKVDIVRMFPVFAPQPDRTAELGAELRRLRNSFLHAIDTIILQRMGDAQLASYLQEARAETKGE